MRMALPLFLLPFNDAYLVFFWGGFTLFCVSSASIGYYLARHLSSHPGRGKDCSDPELQALTTLFVPTCSGALLELRNYPLVKSISSEDRSNKIILSSKALYSLVCDGLIELRHDAVLDGLLTGELEIKGCKFCVEAPKIARWQAICWILRSYLRNQRIGMSSSRIYLSFFMIFKAGQNLNQGWSILISYPTLASKNALHSLLTVLSESSSHFA